MKQHCSKGPDPRVGSPNWELLLKCLAFLMVLATLNVQASPANADPLVVTSPTSIEIFGSGQGKRAVYRNAGTVGAQTVDLVGVVEKATLDHTFEIFTGVPTGSLPPMASFRSVGQDNVWMRWYLFEAGAYNINDSVTSTTANPVIADIHIQINDIDGPNNERVFVPVCNGSVAWVRIDSNATTGKEFGTVNGENEILSVIGDKDYISQPESGVEINYPNTSNFHFGRTANSNFIISIVNPNYSEATTLDYQCADFKTPAAANDAAVGIVGSPTSVSILDNDTGALANTPPQPSEFAKQAVSLVAPGSATNKYFDARGDLVSFDVPGEGSWSQDDVTGVLTFTPVDGFKGIATPIGYTYLNGMGDRSNTATVSLTYPAIGVVSTTTFNDTNSNGFSDIGETLTVDYLVKAFGDGPLRSVSVTETGFNGAGTAPTPTYLSGDTNGDGLLDLTETWIYRSTYQLTKADIENGTLSFQARADAQTSGAVNVSDLSDSADGGPGGSGPGSNNNDASVITLPTPSGLAINNETAPPLTPGADQPNLINVLDNDTLHGAAVNNGDVTVTVITPATPATPGAAVPVLDTNTGIISSGADVPDGVYKITYQVCDKANPADCKTADVIMKSGGPLAASADILPVIYGTPISRTNVINVLDNDAYGSSALSSPSATVTPVGALPAGVTLNPDGSVDFANYTPNPTDSFSYQVCMSADPTICTTATVSTASLEVNGETAPPLTPGTAQPNLVDVLANDTLYGKPATAINTRLTVITPAEPVTAGAPVPVLNPITGIVSSGADVPDGVYNITYQLCEIAIPTNCATNVVRMSSGAGLSVKDDTVPLAAGVPITEANVQNVLDNDAFGGTKLTGQMVTVTPVGAMPTGITLNSDGSVDLTNYTPSATDSFTYQICLRADPSICKTSTATIAPDTSLPSVSGIAYFDINNNDAYTSGTDKGGTGYIVELVKGGQVVKSGTSDANGRYEVSGFAPGTGYKLVFRDPTNHLIIGSIENLTFSSNTVLTDENKAVDPRGIIYSSATGQPVAGARVDMTTASGTLLPAACLFSGQQSQVTGSNGAYRFDINAGADALCPAAETEYRLVVTSPSGFKTGNSVLVPPQPGALDATTCPGDAVPGGTCQVSATHVAPPANSPTPYYLAFLLAPGDPDVINNHIALDQNAAITSTGLSILNTTDRSVVERGGAVGYTIQVTNANRFDVGPVDLIDVLPAGFLLSPDTVKFNGVPATPLINGRSIRFANVTIPATGSITLTFSVRVPANAASGDYINLADLIDPATGAKLAPTGKSTVRIDVDGVFDCSDIIGKVFDDRNQNGIQDNSETGLPGVRLATVNGVLITTDKHGRYNVPCAAVPNANRGSNFILKLDVRSLPTGFSMTTENPRVVRLTRGKATKINFGVTIAQAMKVQISDRAFYPGNTQPRSEIGPIFDQIIHKLRQKRSVVQLVYQTHDGSELAKARLRSFETILRTRGKQLGVGNLVIERQIVRR